MSCVLFLAVGPHRVLTWAPWHPSTGEGTHPTQKQQ